jgi:hypothetical protein
MPVACIKPSPLIRLRASEEFGCAFGTVASTAASTLRMRLEVVSGRGQNERTRRSCRRCGSTREVFRRKLSMVGHGERDDAPRLRQNHVAAGLTPKDPADTLSNARRASRPETTGRSGNSHLDFDGPHRQRQPLLCTNLEATYDSLVDVGQRIVLVSALADAAGDGRAFSYNRSGFIALQRDEEFHSQTLSCEEVEGAVAPN